MSDLIPASLAEAANAIQDETLRANALALVERMGSVIEGIGDKPIHWHPSMLKLVQSMSNMDRMPEGTKAGRMVLEGQVFDDIDVIPLRIWTSRTFWPEDLENDQKICESPDGKTGWKYGECRTCKFSEWDDTANKVPCTKSLQFMLVTADLGNVFIANFAKSQYRCGLDFEKLVRSTKANIYKHQYRLEPQKNPKNKQVYQLAAHFVPAGTYKITEDVNDFLVELFSYVGESRRHQMEAYEASLQRRREQQHLIASDGAPQNRLAHTDDMVIDVGSESGLQDRDDDSVTYEV